MREFLIVALLGIVAFVAVDLIWFEGKYTQIISREMGLDISSAKRR